MAKCEALRPPSASATVGLIGLTRQPMEPTFATFASKRVDALVIQAASTAISRLPDPDASGVALTPTPAHINAANKNPLPGAARDGYLERVLT